jgi:hypothetical protein
VALDSNFSYDDDPLDVPSDPVRVPYGDGRPRVYYARAVDELQIEAVFSEIRDVQATFSRYGFELVDPVASEPGLSGESMTQRDRARVIVDHDLTLLRQCDAVLMEMTVPNRNYIGCISELVYSCIWQIPCVVHAAPVYRSRPWLIYHATAIFGSRKAAIRHLVQLLGGSHRASLSDP